MDKIHALNIARLVESIVITAIDIVLAVLGIFIFFITVFADPSFETWYFFLFGGILVLAVLINFLFIVLNSVGVDTTKKIISGNQIKPGKIVSLKSTSVVQIVIDIVTIFNFSIALVYWVFTPNAGNVFALLFLGVLNTIHSILNLIQSIMTIKKVNLIK